MIKHAKTACVGLGHSWMSVLTGFFYTVTACCSSKANELLEARNWSRSEHRCLMAAVTIWCPHLSTKYLSLAAFNKRTIKSRHKHTHNVSTHSISIHIIKGSLEIRLPTICTDEKQSRAEAKRRERLEERRVEEKEQEERRCRCAKR